MKLSTRDFGIVEVDESEIVTFTGPIFGFESYRKFVFLYQEDISEHFIWRSLWKIRISALFWCSPRW